MSWSALSACVLSNGASRGSANGSKIRPSAIHRISCAPTEKEPELEQHVGRETRRHPLHRSAAAEFRWPAPYCCTLTARWPNSGSDAYTAPITATNAAAEMRVAFQFPNRAFNLVPRTTARTSRSSEEPPSADTSRCGPDRLRMNDRRRIARVLDERHQIVAEEAESGDRQRQ
jgi:hypothetical protein